MCRPECTPGCLWKFMSASECVHVCVCEYATPLHDDSIPRLWLSIGLSLAVASHHSVVIETAEQRAAYEQ